MITSIGLAYGINTKTNKNFLRCQWLPGGCILFSKYLLKIKFDKIFLKINLFVKIFFFSLQRNMKKFIHYTVVNSIVYTDTSREKFSLSFFIDEIKIRRNLIKYTKGNVFRFYLWSILEFLNRFFTKGYFLIIRYISKAKISIFVLLKHSMACCGLVTIGSFSLKDVFNKIGTLEYSENFFTNL